jgi:hypothetical protein
LRDPVKMLKTKNYYHGNNMAIWNDPWKHAQALYEGALLEMPLPVMTEIFRFRRDRLIKHSDLDFDLYRKSTGISKWDVKVLPGHVTRVEAAVMWECKIDIVTLKYAILTNNLLLGGR